MAGRNEKATHNGVNRGFERGIVESHRRATHNIRKHGHVLTPGRYVGAEAAEEDGKPFEEKMQRLTATLREQMAEGRKLDIAIEANLKELGYEQRHPLEATFRQL